MQNAEDLEQKVVLRIQKRTAKKLWKSSNKAPIVSGSEHKVAWKPEAYIKAEPNLPREAITFGLIYVRIQRNGFRPIDVYLFTRLKCL